MLNALQIREVKELLSDPKKIVITTHKSPDGDAMGSSLGLYNFLIQKGHTVTVVTPNEYPDFLNWLPGNESVVVATQKAELANTKIEEADVIFCLDYNHLKRIDQLEKSVGEAHAVKILIDHHLQPDTFPNYTLSIIETSSTCELIYDFIDMLEEKKYLSPEVGYCLYTGIMTDTGSFRFPSSSAKTHRVAADLIDRGVKHFFVHEKVYDCNTEDKIKLVGYASSEKFKVLKEYNAAYIYLSQKELDRFNYKSGDTEGLVNMGLSLDGIKLSAFFVERNGSIKVSLRSKGTFDVNLFARKHFEGGGHKNAAGGSSNLSLEEVVVKFTGLLKEYKAELNS